MTFEEKQKLLKEHGFVNQGPYSGDWVKRIEIEARLSQSKIDEMEDGEFLRYLDLIKRHDEVI